MIGLRACRNCRWMHRQGNELECRLRPPHVQALVAPTPQGPRLVGKVTVFPAVEAEWVCGAHKLKEERQEASR